jgi:hypothetical protein
VSMAAVSAAAAVVRRLGARASKPGGFSARSGVPGTVERGMAGLRECGLVRRMWRPPLLTWRPGGVCRR